MRAYAYVRGHMVAIAYGLVVLALIVGMYRVETIARGNHSVLCNFKDDLERRAEQTEMFVGEILNGVRDPIPGISLADLERSYANQTATLESLSDLDCG